MTSLEKKVQTGQLHSVQEFEKLYTANVAELSTRTDKNVTIFGVVEDYKKALALLKNQGLPVNDTFNRDLFNQILAKIKAIGITNWRSDMPELQVYRTYLVHEVQKKDQNAAISFQNLFSDDFIKSTSKDIVQLFYQAFSHYVEISVNLHQYTRTTIMQNNRISNSCFEDLKRSFSDPAMKHDIATVQDFLNDRIQEVLEGTC